MLSNKQIEKAPGISPLHCVTNYPEVGDIKCSHLTGCWGLGREAARLWSPREAALLPSAAEVVVGAFPRWLTHVQLA